jgi:hypothetical protein
MPLNDLLRRAAESSGIDRIDYRDPIAAFGSAAIVRLSPWLTDPRLGPFAVVTITKAGSLGATTEAIATLRQARPRVEGTVANDIDRALVTLAAPKPRSPKSEPRRPVGSPATGLEVIRALAADWRARGAPPQRAITWRQDDWIATFPKHEKRLRQLPASLDRSDVRRAASEADRDPLDAEFAFLVVKAWGEGENGYGPHRARESLQLSAEPGRRLMAAAQTLGDRGALAAYRRLADGGDCRIFKLGPAFGTKYLYFCQPHDQRPRALIHDKNVADWLSLHAGVALGADAWSAARYADYLKLMHTWAEDIGCLPDDVELCMFQSMLGAGNQWNDA